MGNDLSTSSIGVYDTLHYEKEARQHVNTSSSEKQEVFILNYYLFHYVIKQIENDFKNKSKIIYQLRHLKQSNSTLFSYPICLFV